MAELKPFNQALDDDLLNVFFNLDEFGESGELAGHENIQMVWEPLELELPDTTDDRTSVNYDGVTVYVRREDVPDDLQPQRVTTFQGEEWFVLDTTDTEVMRTIKLYRERT